MYDNKIAAIHSLRVNVKSLAYEAKVIRHEARRAGVDYRCMLHNHRVGRLREEARYTQLALACVRGVPYKCVEHKCHVKPVAELIRRKITRHAYLPNISPEKWLAGG